jgi:hypothetical protein
MQRSVDQRADVRLDVANVVQRQRRAEKARARALYTHALAVDVLGSTNRRDPT